MAEHYFNENPTSLKKRGLIKCNLRGLNLEFVTDAGVFSNRRIDSGTRLLVDYISLPALGSILDLGCGYGVIGIVAALVNPKLEVWLTDVNTRAIELTTENVKKNGVTAIVRQGNLYEPCGEMTYDLIITNPPISAGMKRVVEPIVSGARGHLKEKGSFLTVIQSNKGGKALLSMMNRYYGQVEVIGKRGGYRVLEGRQPLKLG